MEKTIFKRVLFTQILSELALTMCVVIDGMLIGRFLGVDSMSAYGLTNPIILLYAAIGGMISASVQILGGQALGRGNREVINHLFSTSIAIVVFFSIIEMSLTCLFANPLSVLLGAEDGSLVCKLTSDYLMGYIIGCPGFIGAQVLIPFLQLAGERKLVLKSILAMIIGNIGADLLVVFVFHGGTFGMGLASALSYDVALVILASYFFKRTSSFKFIGSSISGKLVGQILALGIPYAVYRLCRTFQIVIVNKEILLISQTTGIAICSVVRTVLTVGSCFGKGIAATVLTMTGVFYAEKNKTGLYRIIRLFSKYSIIIMSVIIIICELFARPLVTVFLREKNELIDAATLGLRITLIHTMLFSINCSFRSFYQATSKIKLSQLICILQNFLFVSCFTVILGNQFGMEGVWWAMPLGELLTFVTLFIITILKNHGIKFGAAGFAMLESELVCDEKDRYETNISSKEQISGEIERIQNFCINSGLDRRKSLFTAICIDEIVSNVLSRGSGKSGVDIIVAKDDKKEWFISLRDDGNLFDPVEYLKMYEKEEKESDIGLKMVSKISKDMRYTDTFGINNIIINM